MNDLSAAQAATLRMLGPLEGARIPGGCDRCDAYQTAEAIEHGVWRILIHHDDWCPFLAARERRAK